MGPNTLSYFFFFLKKIIQNKLNFIVQILKKLKNTYIFYDSTPANNFCLGPKKPKGKRKRKREKEFKEKQLEIEEELPIVAQQANQFL